MDGFTKEETKIIIEWLQLKIAETKIGIDKPRVRQTTIDSMVSKGDLPLKDKESMDGLGEFALKVSKIYLESQYERLKKGV